MKKSLLVLTAALSFGFAAAQTAPAAQVPTLTDVPAGHWAKDAIDKIVAKGIILGYPDGTFRGTQNLTRYEAAVIIARLLDQMGTGAVTTDQLGGEALTSLQNAVQELAADLAALGVRVSDLEANSVSQDDFARLEAQVNDLSAASGTGDTSAVDALTQQIADVTTRVDDLQSNYDSLRADVDDNASSIAALNDLTVLLNNDILGLQDRVSAVETAQADFVKTADFNTLSTTVTNIDNRVKQLEKYAFSVKPSLTAEYYVARASRNFDVDKLIAGTAFSTGDDGNADTKDTAVDYADLTGSSVPLGAPTTANNFGFAAPVGSVNVEGRTTIGFTLDFTNSGNFGTATSASRGYLVPSAGGLNVNKVDINFGVRAGLPGNSSSTTIPQPIRDNYPDAVASDGTVYRPLFFFFKNATVNFTVGTAPVIVDFGKGQKFKFSDLIFDNDKTGRGDGYIVTVDGSTLPGFGAFKPIIKTVYGSYKGGTTPSTDNRYYRGVRFEITPVGTLKAGINVAQEGGDTFATGANATDNTVFGADLHGALAGFQIDSELASSRTTPAGGATTTANALYTRVSGKVGPVNIYDLNFRALNPNYGKAQGIMEADPLDGDNGSTALYAANQVGYGTKIGVEFGPVAVGGYYDRQTAWVAGTGAGSTLRVDRGIAAKVNLLNLVTIRGGFAEYLSDPAAFTAPARGDNYGTAGTAASKYNVQADITAPLGLSLGAYYRHVSLTGTRGVSQDDGSYFRNSRYGSYYTLADNVLTDTSGCGYQHPGVGTSDTDGVGGVLTTGLNNGTDKKCYTEYGVELAHTGSKVDALVKGLDFRVGYANRYRAFSSGYSNSYFYGDTAYGSKLGAFNINLEGAFARDTYSDAERNQNYALPPVTDPVTPLTVGVANQTAAGIGLKVTSDALPVIFKPQVEGQIGYYTRSYDYGTGANNGGVDYTATGLKYVAGVKLNEFILPNSKFAVYYAGYRAQNRQYTPVVNDITVNTNLTTTVNDSTAGAFTDSNNGRVTNQTGLYFEGNYYDLAFAYGLYSLSQKGNAAATSTTEYAVNPAGVVNGAAARGQVFKISYKVNF
jgi:hypothetical protein